MAYSNRALPQRKEYEDDDRATRPGLIREPGWTDTKNVHKLRMFQAAAFIDCLRPNVLDWETLATLKDGLYMETAPPSGGDDLIASGGDGSIIPPG